MQATRSGVSAVLFRSLALLVLLLIGALGYVQAVHVHDGLAPEQGSARSHCSLCVVTHNAAQVTAATAGPVPIARPGYLAVAEPQLHARLLVSTTFIRPPPQSV